MSIFDVILVIIYLPLCLRIGRRIQRKHIHNPLYRKWFMKGLWAKLLGGLAFALVYTFYYEYGGDTRTYFRDSLNVVEAMTHGPRVYWDVLIRNVNNVSSEALNIITKTVYWHHSEYYVVNFTSVFTLLGLGSYFSTTLLMALFTYWGVWLFFLLLVEKYPQLEKQMAFSILFMPSVFFWGSGIGKDSLVLCGIGLILYHINILASGRVWKLSSWLVILAAAFYIFKVKAYVLVSLLPAIALWRTLYLKEKIRNPILRGLALPVIAGIAIVAMITTLDFLAKYNTKYSVDSFVATAQSMQGWHYVEGQNTSDQYGRGSSYTLGEYDGTSWKGVAKVFPAALNVTFFRPYLWEVKNAGMLAQSLESTLFFIFAVLVVLRAGLVRTYRYIANDAFLLMCVVFAVFFGFAVGFSSYNFGALSRYKIPAVPFFAAALFVIRYKALHAKQIKFVRAQAKQKPQPPEYLMPKPY